MASTQSFWSVPQHEGTAGALASADEVTRAEEIVLVNNACAAFTPRALHLLGWGDFQSLLDTALKVHLDLE